MLSVMTMPALASLSVRVQVNREYHILPGVGNYGDRYFGTEPD